MSDDNLRREVRELVPLLREYEAFHQSKWAKTYWRSHAVLINATVFLGPIAIVVALWFDALDFWEYTVLPLGSILWLVVFGIYQIAAFKRRRILDEFDKRYVKARDAVIAELGKTEPPTG